MNLPEILTWVGGIAEPSALPSAACDVVDPNTGTLLSAGRESSPEQIERAIAAATAAHADGRWADLASDDRAVILERWAQLLDTQAAQIAQLDALNAGVPITVTELFASSAGDTVREAIRLSLAQGDEISLEAGEREVLLRRVPWGPTALITPWNAPSAMVTKKLAYALAAGATVAVKPSPVAPYSAQLVVAAAVEAGVPSGVISLVTGGATVGAALTEDERIRAISMTGSTPAGRAIAGAAAPRFARVQLELGSNNPAVVLPDAHIAQTAQSLVSGAMKLSGQWCEAPRHVFVVGSPAGEMVEALVAALIAELNTLVIGSSLEPSTTLGPTAYAARVTELNAQRDALVASGARAVTVGSVPDSGSYFAPTLVIGENLQPDSEIFGPLLLVEPVADVATAIRRANSGHTGLAAYVYSADVTAGLNLGRQLIAGEVKVNGSSVLDMAAGSAQSFFGTSGIGGHGDADLLQFFTGVQVRGTDAPGLPL